jgi:N-acetylneuraminate synthase/pseudaminic acid synthase
MKINGKKIDSTSPCYIIAEMSANHGGSLEKAKEIIREAKQAGADAIKLQTYTADTITLDCDKPDFCLPSDNPWQSHVSLHSLYQKAYTPWEWHKPIMKRASELGMISFSSPFDESAVDFLEELNVPAYKIASFECNHLPLIKKVASTGKPIIISTGMATIAEIDDAVKVVPLGRYSYISKVLGLCFQHLAPLLLHHLSQQ